jgi:hypothetical protein
MKTYIHFLAVAIFIFVTASCRKKDKGDDCPVCPQIADFYPAHGAKDSTVTITGTNFTTDPDGLKLKVSINGKDAVIKSISNETIKITVPGKCGSGKIRTYYDDELYGESANTFVYDYTAMVALVAGNGTAATTDNSNAASASFYYPDKVFLDEPRQLIYTVENFNVLRKIDASGVKTVYKSANNASDGIRSAVCDKDGNVFVAFKNSVGRLIISSGSAYVTTIAGIKDSASHKDGIGSNARFNNILDIIIDDDNNLYVGESNYVRKIDPTYKVTTIAGSGVSGYLDGPALSCRFKSASALAFSSNHNLYIADMTDNRIRMLSASGTVSTIAGNGTAAVVNGVGTLAQLDQPQTLTIDNNGYLYFSEFWNNLIRRVNLATGEVSFFSGSLTASGDVLGLASTALYKEPKRLAYSKTSNIIYLSDVMNNKIKKITFE